MMTMCCYIYKVLLDVLGRMYFTKNDFGQFYSTYAIATTNLQDVTR